jgi:DNA-binding transcriptional MerR regulator
LSKHKAQSFLGGETFMLMTTNEVALRLGCSAENVRVLERTGKLQVEKTQTGRRIFKSEDVDRLAQERAQAREQKQAAKAA